MIPLCSVGQALSLTGWSLTSAHIAPMAVWAYIQPKNGQMPIRFKESRFCKWVDPRDVPFVYMGITGLASLAIAGLGRLLMSSQAQCTLAEYFN